MISRDLLFIEINDQHSVINDYLCIIVKSYADQEMNVTSQNAGSSCDVSIPNILIAGTITAL